MTSIPRRSEEPTDYLDNSVDSVEIVENFEDLIDSVEVIDDADVDSVVDIVNNNGNAEYTAVTVVDEEFQDPDDSGVNVNATEKPTPPPKPDNLTLIRSA